MNVFFQIPFGAEYCPTSSNCFIFATIDGRTSMKQSYRRNFVFKKNKLGLNMLPQCWSFDK